MMSQGTFRRQTLRRAGLGLAIGVATLFTRRDATAAAASLVPAGAASLSQLMAALEQAPRRRDYKTVPMILNARDQWDHEALDAVIVYKGGPKQVWDNTDLGGPWLNLMRNSVNAEVWSFQHPDFLCVSATHGPAHLALYDDAMWEKYQFAKLTDGKFKTNTLLAEAAGVPGSTTDYERPDGLFSPKDNRIATLQRRGVPFLACHNAIWELAARLAGDVNPDRLAVDALAAELTNHLVPEVILTPGAVASLVELQHAGFTYAK